MSQIEIGNMTETAGGLKRFIKTGSWVICWLFIISGIVGSGSVAICNIAYKSSHVLTSFFLIALSLNIVIYPLILKVKVRMGNNRC